MNLYPLNQFVKQIAYGRKIKIRAISEKQSNKYLQSGLAVTAIVIGTGMVILAILDPDPTSSLTLLIVGGAIIALVGIIAGLVSAGQDWELSI